MKKTFDTSGMANQLRGASAFFPYENKADEQEQITPQPQSLPEQVNTTNKSPNSPPVAPLERTKPNQPPTSPSPPTSELDTELPAATTSVRSNERTNETTF